MPVARLFVLVAVIVLALPRAAAWAQQPEPAPASPKPPVVTAGPEGFSIASADGAFKFGLSGFLQFDGRRYIDDEVLLATDTFVARRVRLQFNGVLYKKVEFRISPDFGDGKTQLLDAYVDVKFARNATLRMGKFKPYFGMERLQSPTDIHFVEMGLATNLSPNRDLGFALVGEAAQGVFWYSAGLYNGVVDAAQWDVDDNDGKELAARVLVRPWRRSRDRNLQSLSAAIAWSHGDRNGNATSTGLTAYRSPGQLPFFRFRAGSVANGTVDRVSPQFSWTVGRASVMAEHVTSWYPVTRNADHDTVRLQAWTASFELFLTGDRGTFSAVSPARPFKSAPGARGAVEVALRVGRQTFADNCFPVFADPDVSARDARSWGVSANWYPNRFIKVMVNYDRTDFTGGGLTGGAGSGENRPTEHALFSRLQLRF